MLDDLNPVQEWGRASSLIYCYCNLLWQGLPPVFGVFAPWDTDSISLHCVWVQDLPQRMWLLKQVKSMLSQRTHLPLVYILHLYHCCHFYDHWKFWPCHEKQKVTFSCFVASSHAGFAWLTTTLCFQPSWILSQQPWVKEYLLWLHAEEIGPPFLPGS